MPIRTMPWDAITADDVRDLISRRIRESRTLDFKQSLEASDKGKLDFVQDVTAMANADGGTIIYGAVEGDGEDRGLIVDVKPLAIRPDELQTTLTNILRDGVEERIAGVLHGALPLDGGYLYIVRVPPSPLAPHMVIMRSSRLRFYLRANTSNDPMTVRQIKEAVLRADRAEDRAIALVDRRTDYWRAKFDTISKDRGVGRQHVIPAGQVLLHVIPLFPPPGGVDLADATVLQRFCEIPPFYMTDTQHVSHVMNLDGFATVPEFGDVRERSCTRLLRSGALEFQATDVLNIGRQQRPTDDDLRLDAQALEEAVLAAMSQAAGLAEAGLVMPPVVVSLRLLRVRQASLTSPGMHLELRKPSEDTIAVDPVVVNNWALETASVARRLFDVVWQAWGFPRSQHYGRDGTRREHVRG
jgi:schlafen family protein